MTPKIEFGSAEDLQEFWGFVQMLMEGASPWVMISFAVAMVGLLITFVIRAFMQASKGEDDDYDIKHY